MNVKILEITPNATQLLYRAFKTCVSACNPTEIKIPMVETAIGDIPDNEKMIDLIKRHILHESVMEHINITFAIEGVSRSLSHQLVRHRVASYSQQSQRYVKLGQFEYVIPPEIEKDENLKDIFLASMSANQRAYDILTAGLIRNGRTEKQAIEDARYVFPNACCTNLIWTCNLREFRHAYAERGCKKYAQWEINQMIEEAMKEVKSIIPFASYKAKKCGISCFECYKTESSK